MIIPVGKTNFHKTMYFSLNRIPHVKVAGVTGSGKTKFMEYLVYYMASHESPKRLGFIIIDLKGGASFAHFINFPHVLGLYADIDEAEQALTLCHLEMNMRLMKIRQARANFEPIPVFPRVVIIIDEGGEMSPELGIDKEDKAQRSRIYKHLSSIARIGREPRIHIVFGTQQPSAETLPTNIRGQLEATFCFQVENEIDSKIVIRHEGAEKLPKIPGRCIYKSPFIGEKVMQAFYVPDEILERFVKQYKVERPRPNKLESPSGDTPGLSGIDFTDFIET